MGFQFFDGQKVKRLTPRKFLRWAGNHVDEFNVFVVTHRARYEKALLGKQRNILFHHSLNGGCARLLGADVKDTFFKQWKFTVMKGAWGYYCQTYPTWSRSGEVEANLREVVTAFYLP